MMRAWLFHGPTTTELDDPTKVVAHLGHKDELVWLDVEDPTDGDYVRIGEQFDLHPLAVEDARERGLRPRLDQYPGHAFLVAYGGTDPDHLAEIDIFIGPDWIVTLRDRSAIGSVCDVDAVHERFAVTRGRRATPGMLLYELLDHVVDGYFDAADCVEDNIEAAEDAIWVEETGGAGEVQRQLLALRAQLVHLRRAVVPLRDVVLSILRDEVPFVNDKDRVYFQNVLDHLLRSVDQIDTARELLGNAVDAHLAVAANNMNVVMKKMTSWGAILLGSSLIAGIYGMNFRLMPGLDNELGFASAIGSMALLTVGLALWFKRKNWL